MISTSTAVPGKTGHYAPIAVFLHWLMAILIVGMLGLGWYMMSIEDEPGSSWYFDLHKSIGVIIVVIVTLRGVWRLGHQAGALPARVPRWQAIASRVTHWLLYLAMIVMPIFGIIGALFSEKGTALFGYTAPRLLTANRDIAETLFSAHSVLAWLLTGLISVHVLAALKHLVIDKDGVFQRMWFSKN